MESVPLAARVVEVIADHGKSARPRYRYGSGCIVAGRAVLTAAHVVAGARVVQVRNPNKVLYAATVDQRFVGEEDGPRPDLALVEIDERAVDLDPMALAVVDRGSADAETVERCHAVGYPWFAERPSPTAVRDTADAYGHVPVLSKLASGLLSLQVSSTPRPLPPQAASLGESEWSGMSGAPVVAAGCLLGVVTEHAPREGPSAITVTPFSALEADPAHPGWGDGVADPAEWCKRLGIEGLAAVRDCRPDAGGRNRRTAPPCGRSIPAAADCWAGSGSWPRSPRSLQGRRDTGGWRAGRGPARRRCSQKRSRRRCRDKWTWSPISCRVGRQTRTATGVSLRWCPS